MEKKTSIQQAFLKKLEMVIPANTSLVSELAEKLDVSTDSAYRRIRGETTLTIDEVVKLCSEFKISFDSLNDSDYGIVTFKYNTLENIELGFQLYLESLLNDLKLIKNSKQKQIIYACEDIPVFHNFNYPELGAFKMFYWMKSIMNVPELQNISFDTAKIPKIYESMGKEIFSLYANIPSIEIWTENTITGTLKQIEFYYDAGIFSKKEDALMICNVLGNTLSDIQKQAEASHKFVMGNANLDEDSSYTVYFSEIEITNNCVLVNMGDVQSVYLGHLTFNIMSTTNSPYCKETERWLNGIIKKSTLISGISEKYRYQFFKKSFGLLEKLKQKIEID